MRARRGGHARGNQQRGKNGSERCSHARTMRRQEPGRQGAGRGPKSLLDQGRRPGRAGANLRVALKPEPPRRAAPVPLGYN